MNTVLKPEMPALSLRQVASMIPCHPKWLRIRINKNPTDCPPFVRDEKTGVYSFPFEPLQEWFARRDELRRKLKRPFLRFMDKDESPFEAASEAAQAQSMDRASALVIAGELLKNGVEPEQAAVLAKAILEHTARPRGEVADRGRLQ